MEHQLKWEGHRPESTDQHEWLEAVQLRVEAINWKRKVTQFDWQAARELSAAVPGRQRGSDEPKCHVLLADDEFPQPPAHRC